jgi:hypothetical protein
MKAAAMKTTAPAARRSRHRRQHDGRGHRKRQDPGDKRLRNPDYYNLHIDPAAEPPDELFATGSTLGVFNSKLPTNSGGLTVTRRWATTRDLFLRGEYTESILNGCS